MEDGSTGQYVLFSPISSRQIRWNCLCALVHGLISVFAYEINVVVSEEKDKHVIKLLRDNKMASA